MKIKLSQKEPIAAFYLVKNEVANHLVISREVKRKKEVMTRGIGEERKCGEDEIKVIFLTAP